MWIQFIYINALREMPFICIRTLYICRKWYIFYSRHYENFFESEGYVVFLRVVFYFENLQPIEKMKEKIP